MSSRHTRSFFGVMLAVVFALSAVVVAPASAKLTKHQKAHIRHKLMRQIKHNPKLIRNKRFIKKASLVNFKLPVTIKLRGYKHVTDLADPTTANPNAANIDLGASLGQRQINLGGALAAEIVFHDSFDGGALGNVDVNILDGPKSLTSTSIPLLWNDAVNSGNWDAALTGVGTVGCGDFTNANANTSIYHTLFGEPLLPVHPSPLSPSTTAPGFPTVDTNGNPTGDYVPVNPGVDDYTNLQAYKIPGNDDYLGGNEFPFPSAADPNNPDPNAPITSTPSVQDTVLRTTALALQVAKPGTDVNQSTDTGVNGSQDIVIGKSGGQANLFGKIPGKSYGVDVTVSLATKINSILRAVDTDTQHLVETENWPSALFNCRQAITGYVQNYIPGVRLKGDLTISPAIMPNGDLRIAKVSLSSPSDFAPAHVSLAACLSPYSALDGELNSTDGTAYPVPSSGYTTVATGVNLLPTSDLPADPTTRRDSSDGSGNAGTTGFVDHSFLEGKAGECNSAQTTLTSNANFSGLSDATTANGYTVTNDGSKVSVAGDLTVTDVEADVLIGDV